MSDSTKSQAGEMLQQQQETGTVSGTGAGVGDVKAFAQIGKWYIFKINLSLPLIKSLIYQAVLLL